MRRLLDTRKQTSRALWISLSTAFLLTAIPGCDGNGNSPVDAAEGPGGRLPAPSFWESVAPVTHLIDLPVSVIGAAPAPRRSVRWEGARSAEWTISGDEKGARITSPELMGDSDLTVFSFRLIAPGATEVITTPLLRGGGQAVNQRVMRNVRRVFRSGSDPDTVRQIRFDLTETIHGNWLDETRDGQLSRVEVVVVGGDPKTLKLEGVIAEPPGAHHARVAAGAERIDLGGIVRPSWFVHAGREVRVTTQVPMGSAELRWHGGGAAQRVRVVGDEEGSDHELARHPASDSPDPSPWTFHSNSLAQWQGQEITLAFSVSEAAAEERADEALGYFGDPRIVIANEGEAARRKSLVIVYMVDTLRADRLGRWESEFPTKTPVFDKLAAEGAVFKAAISTSAWTKPAIPSLMTGFSPTTHSVGSQTYADRLPETVPVLQQVYRDAGWRTVSISASPLGSNLSGLDRGFGTAVLPRYWRGRIGDRNYATATDLHDALLAWQAEEPDQPGLVYLHTIDVHQYQRPYYRSKTFEGVHPYDAAVREADRMLGELLGELEAAPGEPDPTLIVVSDHGESFGDHDMLGHGQGLFQTQVHIPLILWSPDRIDARVIEDPVSLVDLAPTLVSMAGLSFPSQVEGRSLVPYLRGESAEGRAHLGASLVYFPWDPDGIKHFALVTKDRQKLIVTSDGKAQAFDLKTDPGEAKALAAPPQAMMIALQGWLAEQSAALDAFASKYRSVEPGFVDAAQTEQLRELGYIE